MKHLKQTLATYVYNHCNMCNITIYFCNIYLKHLRHTSETYSCDMRFQRNISLLLGRIEAHHRVVFTGGGGSATLLRGGPVIVAACRGREASAARAARRPRPHNLGRAAGCHTWKARKTSATTQRHPLAVLGKASGRAVRIEGGQAG
jgi:hypothetical protein